MELTERQSSQLLNSPSTLVTQRANLGGNDLVNWSTLGLLENPLNPVTSVNLLPNNFSAISSGGLGLKIDIPPTNTPGVTPPFVFQTLPNPGIPSNFGGSKIEVINTGEKLALLENNFNLTVNDFSF